MKTYDGFVSRWSEYMYFRADGRKDKLPEMRIGAPRRVVYPFSDKGVNATLSQPARCDTFTRGANEVVTRDIDGKLIVHEICIEFAEAVVRKRNPSTVI